MKILSPKRWHTMNYQWIFQILAYSKRDCSITNAYRVAGVRWLKRQEGVTGPLTCLLPF